MARPTLQTEATYLADGRTAVWRVPFPWRTPDDVGVKVIDSAGLETVLAVGRDCMLRGFDVFTFVPVGRTVKIWLKADVSEILNHSGAPLPNPALAFPWTPPCPPAPPAPAGGETATDAENPGPVYGGAHPGPCGCMRGQEAPAPQQEARYYADGRTARWHVPFAWRRTTDVAVKVVDGEGVEHPLVDGTDYLLAGQFVYAFVPEGRTVVVYATVPVDGEIPVPSQPPADPCARLVPPPLDPSVAWLLASVQEVRKMQDGGIQMFWTAAGEAVEDCKAAVLEDRNAAAASAEAAAGSAASAAGSAETAETATHYLFNHGVLGFQTKALLDADLDHDANALAFVTNDPEPANNNWYIKLGASGTGSWQASDFNPATSAEADALEAGKADKVALAASGDIAGLDEYGNLTDAGIAASNVATKSGDIAGLQSSVTALENGKADKAADATAGHLASLDEAGNLLDSGEPASAIDELRQGKADKVADATEGNFAGLDEYGNLTDSGRSPADITALEEAVESLEDRKADKFIPAEAGNLAKLSSDGNLRDAGRGAEDFTPLLDYADGEALELEWQLRTSMDVQAVEAKAEDLDAGKADKVPSAEPGNLAKLDSIGNLRDAGRAAEDFTPLLTYANGEALELALFNGIHDKLRQHGDSIEANAEGVRDSVPLLAYAGSEAQKLSLFNAMNSELRQHKDAVLANADAIRDVSRESTPLLTYANGEAQKLAWQNCIVIAGYNDWLENDRHKRDIEEFIYEKSIENIRDTGLLAIKFIENVRASIKYFDESYAQHRLQIRLFDGTNPTSSSKPLLFVVAGQSNAVGFGNYTPYERAVDCGQYWKWFGYDESNMAYVLDAQDMELLPIADPIGSKPKGSAWPAFARRFFALTGRKVLFLSIAQGGSNVTWTGSNSWKGGFIRESRQAIWDAFSAAVPASSYDIGGILWSQGESEAAHLYSYASEGATASEQEAFVELYKDNTEDVWSWLRNLVGAESMPVFVARIGFSRASLEDDAYINAFKSIQKAQLDLCDYESVFPGFVKTPEFSNAWKAYYSDDIHYSDYAYSLIGNVMAHSVIHNLNI